MTPRDQELLGVVTQSCREGCPWGDPSKGPSWHETWYIGAEICPETMIQSASSENLARVADAQKKFAARQRELIEKLNGTLPSEELEALVKAILENQAAFERSLAGAGPAAN